MSGNVYEKLAELTKKNNSITEEMIATNDVKRGLRNKDGSGILTGLTEISSVVGYQKTDSGLEAVPGELLYRGHSINDLVAATKGKRYGFEETIYLLMFGELPKKAELEDFSKLLRDSEALPYNFVRDILSTFKTTNIMNSLARSTLALYSQDENPDSIDLSNLVRQGISLVAKFPTIIANSYRVIRNWKSGTPLIIRDPNPDYSLAENFLHMLRQDGKFTDLEANILDICLVLHADHGGGNNSTFSTRVVSSSETDTYSAIAAAIGSLKGPLHGGANLSVVSMMNDLKENCPNAKSEDELKKYIGKIINKEVGDKSGKVFGFGHAVYTLSDPRAILLRDYAKELAIQCNRLDDFNVYMTVEKLVPSVFAEVKKSDKKICANVDFYSGFVYECLNIPKEVYTPLFAMARVSGWVSHRMEELLVSRRIIRPAYKSVATRRQYVNIDQR